MIMIKKLTNGQIKEINKILESEAFCYKVDNENYDVCCTTSTLSKMCEIINEAIKPCAEPRHIIDSLNEILSADSKTRKNVISSIVFSKSENINIFSDFSNFEQIELPSKFFDNLYTEV